MNKRREFCKRGLHLMAETRKVRRDGNSRCSECDKLRQRQWYAAHLANPRKTDLERFQQRYRVDPITGCWLWTASISQRGYALFSTDGKPKPGHRFAFEYFKGPLPRGLVVDHACHNSDTECAGGSRCIHRRCVNPDHLEGVTNRINILRGKTIAAANKEKTECPRGHRYDVVYGSQG